MHSRPIAPRVYGVRFQQKILSLLKRHDSQIFQPGCVPESELDQLQFIIKMDVINDTLSRNRNYNGN